MEFRISDTFISSLARLSNEEQKAAKTTAFDLQVDPARPGLSFHKLDRAQDPNFASVRVSRDLRLIVHRSQASLLLCYVDHHDAAYRWAERRKLETHPTTGAAQLVEIRETVQEIIVPAYLPETQPQPPLFADCSDAELLGFGVPPEWLADVRRATEATYLELADHLPAEAAEALLELAVGGAPQTAPVSAPAADPFEHPDALRRFRVMENVDELLRALEYPWEQWTVFLHPEQRRFAAGDYNGPARVSGSAGTGKTVVALHRAVYLAKTHPDARVLLLTFSEPLARSLKHKLRMLIHNRPRLGEQIEVDAMHTLGERLYALNLGKPQMASAEALRMQITAAGAQAGSPFRPSFLISEWEQVVDAWQLRTWEAYRDVPRLGRRTRLPENSRRSLWAIYSQVLGDLNAQGLLTYAGLFDQLSEHFTGRRSPFDFIVVDEAQDVSVPQLRLLSALGGGRSNALFFSGDLGQRIFQQPFSWKTLGVDVRGRSRTLRINYRTSHQIRQHADRLLGPEVTDVDGITETRRGTISVFNGPDPDLETFESEEAEVEAVAAWLRQQTDAGLLAEEIGVFVRSEAQLPRARLAVEAAGLPYQLLDQKVEMNAGQAVLCSMHLSKGLEFRAVVVMACDDEVIPLQERIESVSDPADLEEAFNTERHLLYVACTRARDHLLLTAVEPESEFLMDMVG
jgi:hypothetical protein